MSPPDNDVPSSASYYSTGIPPRLQLEGISKVYPTVVANDAVDLVVHPGEIHAVLGENGAGKSTLMKIIYGVTAPSAGRMLWEGAQVRVDNPAEARALGIGMVFQHFSLFETLTVVENVALAMPGKADLKQLAQRIEEVSERYGLPVAPYRHVHALSVGERQRVEIIRCLLLEPRLLIMDEPTSVLTPQAVLKLFETLRQLAAEGCSILYISHKLDEIQALCHRATVLRGGKVTGHCVPAEETPESMARLMIGKDLPACEHGSAGTGGELRLRLAGLSHESPDPFGTDLRDIHLDVHAGEIVGIAGVSGNGQQELLMAISGEEPLSEKHPVQICGVEAGRLSPARRRALGMTFVPRTGSGAAPSPGFRSPTTPSSPRHAREAWYAADSCAFHAHARSPSSVSQRSTSSAAVLARWPNHCPAVTCRSSSSAGRSCKHPNCSSAPSQPGGWTSARPRSSART